MGLVFLASDGNADSRIAFLGGQRIEPQARRVSGFAQGDWFSLRDVAGGRRCVESCLGEDWLSRAAWCAAAQTAGVEADHSRSRIRICRATFALLAPVPAEAWRPRFLLQPGKDVIVLEAGSYYDDADFDGAELGGFQRLYLEGGFAATADQSVGLLAGECLGGGTVINYCTSFRTPDDVRGEWAAAGVPWFTSEEYTSSLDAVCARLSVNLEHNRVSAREQVLAARPECVGLACGGHAAQRGGLRSGQGLWLLRIRLFAGREAILHEDLAG